MSADLLQAAIAENISWCAKITSLHGNTAEIVDDLWINPSAGPPYYPNIITGRKRQDEAVAHAIKTCRNNGLTGFGIKDSFADLVLADQGFFKAIDGHWFSLEGKLETTSDQSEWRPITVDELGPWVTAWHGAEDSPPDIFRPQLLSDPEIVFLACWNRDDIIGGAIVDLTADVAGLSNWFFKDLNDTLPPNLLTAVRTMTDKPIVCWGREPVEQMRLHGLVVLGPMAVWIGET